MNNKTKLRQSLDPNERHSSHTPSRDFRYKDVRFRGPANIKNLNVDGSAAPIDFSFGPVGDEVWLIEYLTLLILDPGDMSHNVFGSLAAALPNGLELIESINGVENIMTTLEDNADIFQCFFGGVGVIQASPGSDPGFMNEVDRAGGRMTFDTPVMLDGGQNDKLIIRVNDDLQLITLLSASAHLRIPKFIPA